ncbi:glycoside hydrolase [Lentinus tigrinus ALCF2SS1-7]|uniref:Glycoside hydrolase n=1 Tax=Lentinus tigrinus ALCF2SS1-6 TaxID=1328759 RepID=A0A5C2ST56_9APHY|nr:glycoside hydrolase [Lentinus tigrinus ALCF2SS1-6]RPD80248.1 glycoside hydrolase [Lentinus tigrinus ALCF2SS1-7]
MVSSVNFATLLQALRLSQGMSKPSPTFRAGLAQTAAPSYNDTQEDTQQFGTSYYAQPEDHLLYPVSFDDASPCPVEPYFDADNAIPPFASFDPAKATVFRYRQQQSVNLGSWFVHEQWMTPSLFTCASGSQISELDIASGWGSPDRARQLLERHWDTFINTSDFQYLASIGINTVRLPIGYWSLGPDFCQGTPFEPVAAVYQNAWSRVVRAINMAADSGIGVLVDLHGAPGSQNGQPHSGISDGQVNLFGNDWFENKTMAVLSFLTQQLVNVTNVVGIQILNEPNNVDGLPDFYARAIATIRNTSSASKDLPLYIHDGFNLTRFSAFVANRTDFVVQDHHSYFVFTASDASESASDHIQDIHDSIAQDLGAASDHQRRNLVVDEFSCALTDQSLNGEANPDQARRDFCEGQMQIYQNETAGWAFWAYNKEDCYDDPGWCFKAAVGKSLPSTFFSYGQPPPTDPSRIPALSDMVSEMGSPSYDMTSPSDETTTSATTTPSTPEIGLFPVRRRSRLHPERRSRVPRTSLPPQLTRKRDENGQLPVDPNQRAISKGYSDGFLTAKIFALYGMSKLGFTGQYISDSLAKLGDRVVQPGTEHYYWQWFMEGLNDGEALISSYGNNSTA